MTLTSILMFSPESSLKKELSVYLLTLELKHEI